MQEEPEMMKDFKSHDQELKLQDGPDDPYLLVFMPLCNPLLEDSCVIFLL